MNHSTARLNIRVLAFKIFFIHAQMMESSTALPTMKKQPCLIYILYFALRQRLFCFHGFDIILWY